MEAVTAMRHEGINTCRQTVWRLEKHIKMHETIVPLRTSAALRNIDEAIVEDDETTAKELVTALRGAGVSISTHIYCLEGTSHRTACCQLVRTQNCERRLCWAHDYLGASFLGLTGHLYKWRHTEGFVVAKMVQSPSTTPALNTLLRFLALAGMDQQRRVCLRESWMLISIG